jgi:hypothetical protein
LISEHQEQVHFIQWFRRKYGPVKIFAVPNGGFRSKATAAKLKLEGVVRGVPDLYVPEWKLWIEMKKATGGRVSPDQRAMIKYLESIGDHCLIGYGCEDAQAKVDFFVDEVLKPG